MRKEVRQRAALSPAPCGITPWHLHRLIVRVPIFFPTAALGLILTPNGASMVPKRQEFSQSPSSPFLSSLLLSLPFALLSHRTPIPEFKLLRHYGPAQSHAREACVL